MISRVCECKAMKVTHCPVIYRPETSQESVIEVTPEQLGFDRDQIAELRRLVGER